jgi:opacity protein-like surface antigen
MSLKAPPIAKYDWSRFYVGGHVGYDRDANTLFDVNPTTANSSFGSLYGGMQFGCNYRPSRLLVGIEGDFSFPNYLDNGFVAGKQDISRITVTAGRFAVLDIFDGTRSP